MILIGHWTFITLNHTNYKINEWPYLILSPQSRHTQPHWLYLVVSVMGIFTSIIRLLVVQEMNSIFQYPNTRKSSFWFLFVPWIQHYYYKSQTNLICIWHLTRKDSIKHYIYVMNLCRVDTFYVFYLHRNMVRLWIKLARFTLLNERGIISSFCCSYHVRTFNAIEFPPRFCKSQPAHYQSKEQKEIVMSISHQHKGVEVAAITVVINLHYLLISVCKGQRVDTAICGGARC